ncbi:MAG: helix-turn-helix transcriptional regulator [Oscillospiraceae bacterium]|jgi:transcriptional regulator with XRE-family HTH domain|nr:helix-turn-helix transcriptional regulator [Oscillospiraceae bacterium]
MKNGLEIFSDRLKKLRNEKGLKQSEMGDLLGCTERNYQRIEYGQINVPATTLMALADYFDVTTDYLLGRSDERAH